MWKLQATKQKYCAGHRRDSPWITVLPMGGSAKCALFLMPGSNDLVYRQCHTVYVYVYVYVYANVHVHTLPHVAILPEQL